MNTSAKLNGNRDKRKFSKVRNLYAEVMTPRGVKTAQVVSFRNRKATDDISLSLSMPDKNGKKHMVRLNVGKGTVIHAKPRMSLPMS